MPTKNIEDAVKPIRDAWETIRHEYIRLNPGKYLVLTCVYRSPSEQLELYKKGRTMDFSGNWVIVDKSQVVTNVDGIKVLGAHNYLPSRAIDVAVVDNQTGKYLWEEIHYYSLVEIAKEIGLVSGGSWKSLVDWPHLEIPNYKDYKDN